MRILEKFIQEYREYSTKKEKVFDDSLTGLVKKTKEELTHRSFYPSKELFDVLDKFVARTRKPMKVAIAGQFSSGKTTFINALLSNSILPTGITPVTSKVNFIEYGTELKLKVTFNSGATEYHSVDNIASYIDQRKDTVDIKFLTLFAPLEILKDIIFVDTPGLNSQSESDTDATEKVLKDVDGIIWLTLIDNAGKHSEEKVLKQYLKNFKDKSICVLNQKDKFSVEQINSTVSYIENVFGEFFVKVIPISAKQALDATIDFDSKILKDSNISEVMNFINESIRPQADEMKDYRIKNDLRDICDILIKEYDAIISIYDSLYTTLEDMDKDILNRFDNVYSIYKNELISLENYLEIILEKIANETYKNIKKSKKDRFETKESFMGQKIKKLEYDIFTLDGDHTIDKLFYNDDGVDKMFKTAIKMIEAIKKDITTSLENVFDIVSHDIVKWQDTYKLVKKQRHISSDKEFSYLRHFAAEIYERVLLSFHDDILNSVKVLSNKLEFLRGALTFGYKQNTIATISHFEKQMIESIELYEKDPHSFSLVNPREEEILTQLKVNFHYEEFQNGLTSRRNYLYVLIQECKKDFQNTNKEKLEMIEAVKDKYKEKCDLILKIKEQI